MKRFLIGALALLVSSVVFAQNVTLDRSQKNAVLKVDGEPFFMLSGELHNSTCSDPQYLAKVWPKLKSLNMNTVIATESWELLEPQEGKFDFSHIDALINGARENDMKVVLIWFGTFKNPFMTYAPTWVKANDKRFPHARATDGSVCDLPSLFDNKVIDADLNAYLTLLKHIKDVDKDNNIIGIQIGNEPGLRTSTRDCSAPANKAWKANVPQELIDYMVANKGTMQPDIENAWKNNGYKTKGSWEEVFGKSLEENDGTNPILHLTEHLFTASAFASYIERLSTEGKKVLNLPTYINATGSVNSRGRSLGQGCSIPDFFDVYMAIAPSVDALTPNSYAKKFDEVCETFSYKGNPIMIPECGTQAGRAFYCIGEWDALGFSPFGIDDQDSTTPAGSLLSQGYKLLGNMKGLIAKNLNSDKMRGVFIYEGKPKAEIQMGDYKLTITNGARNEIGFAMAAALGGDGGFNGGKQEVKPFESGALIIQTGDDEFIVAGCGAISVSLERTDSKTSFCDYDYIYEGNFNDNGEFERGRLLNGDEQNVFIPANTVGAVQVKMYHF